MPPSGVGESAAAVDPIPWQARSDASVARRPILAGHTVETAPGCWPRNPVMRALRHAGEALSRTFAPILPGCARLAAASAARQWREQLERALDHLAGGRPAPELLAADLRRLAEAQRRWARFDPQDADLRFDAAVEELLDRRWPGAEALVIAQALGDPAVVDAQAHIQDRHDLESQRALLQLGDVITRTVTQRGFGTIHRGFADALAVIKEEALSSRITEAAEAAVNTGALVLDQLRECRALAPAAPGDLAFDHRARLEADQKAMILHDCIGNCGASPHEIEVLLQHLSRQSLLTLRRDFGDDAPLEAAVEHEIQTRPTRLLGQLALESSATSRDRSGTIMSHTIGDTVKELADLKQQILDHCAFFMVPVPKQIRAELGTLEHSLSGLGSGARRVPVHQLVKLRDAAGGLVDPGIASQFDDSWMQEHAALDGVATQRAQSLLDQLESGTPAAQLATCKELVASIRALMRANGIEGASMYGTSARNRLQAELGRLLSPLLSKETDEEGEHAPRWLAALHSPEMRTIVQALSDAAAQAQQEGLPTLRADLADACIVLQTLTYELEDRFPGLAEPIVPADPSPMLQPRTRDELAQLYSTVQQPDGRVTLTQGHVAPAVEAIMREVIKRPFSEKEMASRDIGGIKVPEEFVKDAERAFEYFMDDVPLIDRKGWDVLSGNEKNARIAEGYQRLVRFYQNNLQQTEAIVRLAHQGLVAPFSVAMTLAGADSPLLLEGYGRGVVKEGDGTNWASRTLVHFSTGANQRPRLELSYEVRGGRLLLHSDDGRPREELVYLDKERSRAQITLVVEAQPGEIPLALVGTPVYDVHLVRSPIQCPYPIPEVEHLHRPANELYRDLIRFAQQRAPQAVNGLQAMQTIVKARAKTGRWPELAFAQLKILQEEHLRDGAPSPLAVDPGLLDPIRQGIREVEEQTWRVFTGALAEFGRNVRNYLPEETINQVRGDSKLLRAKLREQGGDAARAADFLDRFDQLHQNKNPTVEEAQEILRTFFDERGAGSALFTPETIAETHSSLQRVMELRDHLTGPALEPLLQALSASAASLLPEFTAELRAQAQANRDPIKFNDL